MTALLHPALRLLWRLHLKAGWRKVARSARTGKGILRLVVTLGVLALMFGPMIFFLQYRTPPDPSAARTFLEPGMLLFTIMTIVGSLQRNSGIYFAPTEVDFLFPGPFQRRELLLYRIGHLVHTSIFGALFLSVAPAPFVPRWTFAFLGIALMLLFIQLLSTMLTLITSLVGQAVYTRARKLVMAIVALPIVVGSYQVLANDSGGDFFTILTEFRETSFGRLVLVPFQAFSRTITAESLAEFLGWGGLAAAINVAFIAIILRLDADFYERSIAVSEKVYSALERARRGEAWKGLAKPAAGRWRVPMPGLWRGAGPIAWRQCVSALRSSRAVIYVVLMMAAGVALLTYATRDEGNGVAIAGLVMFALFMLPQMLQFDFRGDAERIDVLKTLPATPAAVAAGELIAPVGFATAVEWGLLLGIGWLWTDWKSIVAVCAFVPLVNLILFALENILSLYYPRRPGTVTAFQGRQMALTLVKSVALAVVAAVSAGAGVLAYRLTGQSMAAGLVTAWCIAAVLGASLIPIVAHAFRVTDPSLDTPE